MRRLCPILETLNWLLSIMALLSAIYVQSAAAQVPMKECVNRSTEDGVSEQGQNIWHRETLVNNCKVCAHVKWKATNLCSGDLVGSRENDMRPDPNFKWEVGYNLSAPGCTVKSEYEVSPCVVPPEGHGPRPPIPQPPEQEGPHHVMSAVEFGSTSCNSATGSEVKPERPYRVAIRAPYVAGNIKITNDPEAEAPKEMWCGEVEGMREKYQNWWTVAFYVTGYAGCYSGELQPGGRAHLKCDFSYDEVNKPVVDTIHGMHVVVTQKERTNSFPTQNTPGSTVAGSGQYQIYPVAPLLVDDELKIRNETTNRLVLIVSCCGRPIPTVTTISASIGDVLSIVAMDDIAPCYGFNTFMIKNVTTGVEKMLVKGTGGSICGAARPTYPAVYYNGRFTIDF